MKILCPGLLLLWINITTNGLWQKNSRNNRILITQTFLRVQAVMVYHDHVYQSCNDVKVSTIENFLYANDIFILLDASKI